MRSPRSGGGPPRPAAASRSRTFSASRGTTGAQAATHADLLRVPGNIPSAGCTRDPRQAAGLRAQCAPSGTREPSAMAFLWLALCLTPACCLLHKDEDPESPIKNLRMQPETRRLTWDLSGNVSEIGCFINSRFITKATDKRYCEFRVLSSCQVTNFTVASTGDRPFSAGILYPRPEGHPEAAAQRLGCWVHDVDFLTCSWEAGRAAPGDVQYRLYWQDLKTYEEEECPRYGVDDRGTHIRCHFDDVSRLGEHVRFLVKGTSKGARIPCSDLTVELARIERLSLPNITGMCNKSYSVMEWKMSSHFNHRFTYELEIQKVNACPHWKF